jgi:pimeloyl-ACP methyl ester carboxylesterase
MPQDLPAAAFRHTNTEVGGLNFHAVDEGEGPVVLLLAGWPQTWYAWRHVIPQLRERARVIALEIRGQGETSLGLDGDFSTPAVAAEVSAYLKARDINEVVLVGHDVGAWVAHAFSILHADQLRSTLLLDAALIGLVPQEAYMPRPGSRTWQFHFHAMADIPEMLTTGREEDYLGWFFRTKAAVAGSMTPAAIEIYTSAYRKPGAMTAGFNYYRAVEINRAFAEAHRQHQFAKPMHVYGGEHATGLNFVNSLKACDPAVEGGVIPGCGHYVPEEAPEAVVELINTLLRA